MIQNGGLAAGVKKIFFKLFRFGKLDKLLIHQIVKGNFPFPPPAQLQDFIYGCMANNNLAKGIVMCTGSKGIVMCTGYALCRLHLQSWKFPLSDNSAGRQHSLLSPLDCLSAKAGGAVTRSGVHFIVDWLGWLC